MNLVISIVGLGISIVSVAMSVWASTRAARLSSEQEQLRRSVRSDAIYGLIATYELIGDLETYFWMAAQEKRVDKDFILAFLSARVGDLNKIHGSPAYYLWKRTVSNFMPNASIAEEPIDKIVEQELIQSPSGKRMLESHHKGVGMALVALEANLWVSSIDALYRLRLYDTTKDESQALADANDLAEIGKREAVVKNMGTAGAEVARILLHYFDSASILVQLLRYYEPDISKHLNTQTPTPA